MKRVLVFGFSVTESKAGYFSVVSKMLDGEFKLTKAGIGGASLSAVPYLSNILHYDQYDYVIFEVATCIRFSEKNPELYKQLAAEISEICRSAGALPCFVNMFRNKVNYEQDHLGLAIEMYARENNLPFLDLTAFIVKRALEGEMAKYLRDGTHTTPLGALYYGEKISEFIRKLPEWKNTSDHVVKSNKYLIPIERFCYPEGEMSRGGLKLAFAKLEPDQVLKARVPDGMKFRGIFFVMGPDTGIYEISSGGITKKAIAYDHFCYYERFSYWLRSIFESQEFCIRQLGRAPEVTLRKGERFAGPRVGRLVGIFAESG